MIPRFSPGFDGSELRAALRRRGPDDLAAFEWAFATEMGQRHAIVFPYGRTALLLLFEALGLRQCDIICPAYTCVVVPHAIVYSGNRPLFVDADGDGNMDLEAVEAAISPTTGAVVATSLFGHPVDLERLAALRRRHPRLAVVQDCAHSFAASWHGREVQRDGVAAVFGLNVSKLVTSVFGGMATTDDGVLAARLRGLRDARLSQPAARKSLQRLLYLVAVHGAFWPPLAGLVHRLEYSGWLDRFTRYYDEHVIDMPDDYLQTMTPLEARVGTAQVRRHRSFIEARRHFADYYRRHLSDLPGLVLPAVAGCASFSHVVGFVTDRSRIMRQAARRGVQLGKVVEYCVPSMPAYRRLDPNNGRYWPMAEWLAEHVINLPVANRFDERAASKVVMVLRDLLHDGPAPRVPAASAATGSGATTGGFAR